MEERIAVEANLPSIQLSALENMHYSYMIKFDNVEEARRLQCEINNLKQSKKGELEAANMARDHCSETDSDGGSHLSDDKLNEPNSPDVSKSSSKNSRHANGVEELNDDEPLISFVQSHKHSSRKEKTYAGNCNTSSKFVEASPKCLSKTSDQQTIVGRKRVRVIISDDEDEKNDENCFERSTCRCSASQDIATSDAFKKKNNDASSLDKFEDFSRIQSKCVPSACNPIEESCCSHKSSKLVLPSDKGSRSSSSNEGATIGSKRENDLTKTKINYTGAHLKLHNFTSNHKRCIGFKIDDVQIDVEGGSYLTVNKTSIESLKVELACLYFLHLSADKREKGLFPVIQHMVHNGNVLESLEASDILDNDGGYVLIEVSISGWVPKRLMKLYIDFCEELSETFNMKLLKKLYISEVEDELFASECDLQDVSITPLLNALYTHKTVAMLDLSHNLLGNETMEKLQKFFISGQTYAGLTLDLHCNRFGPTALFQICESPVLFARLEVLNISGNRLTDACGSYLSTILEKCKALYSLNISQCSITSRTIQKIADAIPTGSVLAHLSIGHNSPVSGNAIVHLLTKLASLESFAELNLNGIKISRLVIDSLCQLAERPCLSRLMLGSTGIGNDGAAQITVSLFSRYKESVKLDLSYCGLTATYIHQLKNDDNLVVGIVELILEGNSIRQEGTSAIVTLLTNPQSCLKVLVLNKCKLELIGVVQVIKALSENEHLEELHLAHNINKDNKARTSEDIETNTTQLVVADSEDEMAREEAEAEASPECYNSGLEELSSGIREAKQLQLLDLSNNDFPITVSEMLYGAWSSSRSGSRNHLTQQIIHFSSDMKPCCRLKPCCTRAT